MPEWHKGPVGPDRRHRRLATIPTETRTVRATPRIADTADPTPLVNLTSGQITPLPLHMRMEAVTPHKAAILEPQEAYLPSNPPSGGEDADSSRSPSPVEPPLALSAPALHTLREAVVAAAAAHLAVAAAVEELLRSTGNSATN